MDGEDAVAPIDHKAQRAADVKRIKDSKHPRKVVVAGPGTGKSFLFGELIKQKRAEGKTSFKAITFIGKLGDALADDLCGLADTTTMHGLARELVLRQKPGWEYYPFIKDVIFEDLKADGVEAPAVGSPEYWEKTEQYAAVGHDDVVHYAIKLCDGDSGVIPGYDLLLVDEFQDFNEVEARFVDILASKSETVIVGDDDQALYAFKGSSPSHIRKKHHLTDTEWESHILRYCSRCPEVIIRYFHALVAHYSLNAVGSEPADKRISKEYVCYSPENESDSKLKDSRANPQIHLIKDCPPGMIAFKISKELGQLIAEQKIKDVLVIGEGQSCAAVLATVAQQLKAKGFKYVDSRSDERIIPVNDRVIGAYKLLSKNKSSALAWRLLGNPAEAERKSHLKNTATLYTIVNKTPSEIKALRKEDIAALQNVIEHWPSPKTTKAKASVDAPAELVRNQVFLGQLKCENTSLSRPMCNLEITVCNILNSKGLGADVVFIVGFDMEKFPATKTPKSSEIYQMLVAITRTKKRLYLVNTIGKSPSSFVEWIPNGDLVTSSATGKKGSGKKKPAP